MSKRKWQNYSINGLLPSAENIAQMNRWHKSSPGYLRLLMTSSGVNRDWEQVKDESPAHLDPELMSRLSEELFILQQHLNDYFKQTT